MSSRLPSRYFSLTLPRLFDLRDYQHEAVTSVLDASRRGIKRPAVVLATGGGKTVVMAHLIPQLPSPTAVAKKTLVLAHKEELVHQAARTIQSINPNLSVEIDMAKTKPSLESDVVVASVPTLVRAARLHRYDPLQFKTIVLDECHHATATSWIKILQYFNALDDNLHIHVVGFTATLERSDGMSLGTVFEEIVFERTLLKMIEANELCDVRFSTISTDADLSGVPTRLGDYSTADLSARVNTLKINVNVVKAYLDLRRQYGFKSTLIFCVDVEHCKTLCGVLQANGVNAQYVTGETSKDVRLAILDDFRNGAIDVLCNVQVFTEGTDLPNIDSLILARPTKSRPLLVQMVGRGLRLYKGKTHCHVVDLVSTADIGVLSVPTLFGLPPSHKTNSKTFKELEDDKRKWDAEAEKLKYAEHRKAVAETLELQKQMDDLSLVLNTVEGFGRFNDAKAAEFTIPQKVSQAIGASKLVWFRLEYHKWAVSANRQTYILERKLAEHDDSPAEFVFSSYHATPVEVLKMKKFKMPRYKLKSLYTSNNLKAVLAFAENKCYDRYWQNAMLQKPTTPSQTKFLELLILARVRALYGDHVKEELPKQLALLNMLRASNLIFAARWSVHSLWVAWELRRMLGPSKTLEKHINRKRKSLDKAMARESI